MQAQGALRYQAADAAPLLPPPVAEPVLPPAVTELPAAVGPAPGRRVSVLGVEGGLSGAAAVEWSYQRYRSELTVILTPSKGAAPALAQLPLPCG